MPRLRVNLLGHASVEVDGLEVKLPPTSMAVLIRLIIATADRSMSMRSTATRGHIRPAPPPGPGQRAKRILELRGTSDPQHQGEESQLLRTERGRLSAYRLVLDHADVDLFQFQDLVTKALSTNPAAAVDLLTKALDSCGATGR